MNNHESTFEEIARNYEELFDTYSNYFDVVNDTKPKEQYNHPLRFHQRQWKNHCSCGNPATRDAGQAFKLRCVDMGYTPQEAKELLKSVEGDFRNNILNQCSMDCKKELAEGKTVYDLLNREVF